MSQKNKYLTIGDFCKREGISRATESRWRNDGKIPHIKRFGRVFYTEELIEAFHQSCVRNLPRQDENAQGTTV